MTHEHRRNSDKERFWRRMLALCEVSDLSIRAFCQHHQLSEPNFYQWRRIIQQRDQASTPARQARPASMQTSRTKTAAATSKPLFVALEVAPAPSCQGEGALVIVLPRGLELRVRPGFDPATLRQIVQALEDESC
jgi:transposase-like protein